MKVAIGQVNDILDFSKLKNDRIEMDAKAVSLESVIDVVVGLMKPLSDEKNIKLTVSHSERMPMAIGDENRIQQILLNLVGNAVKFTHTGEVTVRLRQAPDNFIEVSIADTGVGIPPVELKQIFAAFQRGQSARDAQIEGTGLGLALCRQLVELQGGQIWLKSELGKGSEFTFTLPCSAPDKQDVSKITDKQTVVTGADDHSLDNDEAASGSGNSVTDQKESTAKSAYRLALVDDDPANLTLIRRYLRDSNYDLDCFTLGSALLEAIQEGARYDLVLLDIMMPEQSGFQICRLLRKQFAMEELPVLFLSAKNQIEDLQRGFRFGANDYVAKPFVLEELQVRIDYQLKMHKSKQLFDSIHDFANAVGSLKTREDVLTKFAEDIDKVLQTDGLAAVLEGNLRLAAGEIIEGPLPSEFQNMAETLSSEPNHRNFMDSRTNAELQNGIDTLSTLPAGATHGLLISLEEDWASFILLLKRSPGFSLLEISYVQSLAGQLLTNESNVRQIVQDRNLFQAINTIGEMLDNIVYVRSNPPYCTLSFDANENKSKDVRASAANLGNYFGKHELLQVHRSYLVNPKYVDLIQRSGRDYSIRLKDVDRREKIIPLSRSRVQDLKKHYSHWFRSTS